MVIYFDAFFNAESNGGLVFSDILYGCQNNSEKLKKTRNKSVFYEKLHILLKTIHFPVV